MDEWGCRGGAYALVTQIGPSPKLEHACECYINCIILHYYHLYFLFVCVNGNQWIFIEMWHVFLCVLPENNCLCRRPWHRESERSAMQMEICCSDCFLKRVGVDKQPPHCEVLPRRFSHMVVLVDCWPWAIGSLSVAHNHTHANAHTLAAFFQSQTISFSLPPALTYHILCSLTAGLPPLHNVRWGDVLWQIK